MIEKKGATFTSMDTTRQLSPSRAKYRRGQNVLALVNLGEVAPA